MLKGFFFTFQILTCGLNNYHQLGLLPFQSEVCTPEVLTHWHNKNPNIKATGVKAGAYHTVIWSDEEIFSCGFNGGQLGHLKTEDNYIDLPITSSFIKKIDKNRVGRIKEVAVSNGATVFVTEGGEVFTCHEYLVRRIISVSKSFLHDKDHAKKILAIDCIGGNLDFRDCVSISKMKKKVEEYELKVAILTSEKELILWVNNILFSLDTVFDFCLNEQHLCIISENHEGFLIPVNKIGSSTIPQKENGSIKSKSNVNIFDTPRRSLPLGKNIPYLYRCYSVNSDPKGNNYVVFQYNPKLFLTRDVGVINSQFKDDMAKFYENIDIIPDNYDTEINIGNRKYPANAYLLSYYSKHLRQNLALKVKERKLCSNLMDEKIQVDLSDIHHLAFEKVLSLMYSNCHFDIYHPDKFVYVSQSNEGKKLHDNVVHLSRQRDGSLAEVNEKKGKTSSKTGDYLLKHVVHACNMLEVKSLQDYLLKANKYDRNKLNTW